MAATSARVGIAFLSCKAKLLLVNTADGGINETVIAVKGKPGGRHEHRLDQATAVACPALYAAAALRAARGGHPLWTPPETREPETRGSEVKGMGAPPREIRGSRRRRARRRCRERHSARSDDRPRRRRPAPRGKYRLELAIVPDHPPVYRGRRRSVLLRSGLHKLRVHSNTFPLISSTP